MNLILLVLIALFSCKDEKQHTTPIIEHKNKTTSPLTKREVSYHSAPEFNDILKSAKVKGSILFYDENTNSYFSNDFEWAKKGFIPASTYKIPNSIIALELGIVENDSVLFKWDGVERSFDEWNQDLIFRKAFHYSCVPIYQDITRKVGLQKMRSMVQKFDYGNMDITNESLDQFWLSGNSKITQFEQIEFLRKYHHGELPISKRTEKIAKRMMTTKYKSYPLLAKSGRSMDGVSWYVGYIIKNNDLIYFATNITDIASFSPNQRKMVTIKAFDSLF